MYSFETKIFDRIDFSYASKKYDFYYTPVTPFGRKNLVNTRVWLEWGSRGLEFESRHSDQQKVGKVLKLQGFRDFSYFWGFIKLYAAICENIILLHS